MVEKDFQRTHELILASALKLFAKSGYLDTNLRDISHDAGLTTGAIYQHFKNKADIYQQLVQPFLDRVKRRYLEVAALYLSGLTGQTIRANWDQNANQTLQIVDVVYDDFLVFKLLAFGAEGTPYENLIEHITIFTEKETRKYFTAVAKTKQVSLPRVAPDILHLLIHAYWAAFVDVLKHDYGRAVAKQKLLVIDHFFNLGWEDLYQI